MGSGRRLSRRNRSPSAFLIRGGADSRVLGMEVVAPAGMTAAARGEELIAARDVWSVVLKTAHVSINVADRYMLTVIRVLDEVEVIW